MTHAKVPAGGGAINAPIVRLRHGAGPVLRGWDPPPGAGCTATVLRVIPDSGLG